MQRFEATALAGWLADVFAGCGLDREAAATAARVLVRTSARGVDTHGVSRALVYAQKLRSGELTARPNVVLEDRAGVLHCHADGGMGQVVATRAVQAAVERAMHSGFVPVVMHEIGHLGALGIFALQAAEDGMIAFVGQSAPPIMALPGASAAAIGNNPLAFASPVGDGPPLVFDIAASKVARGNVLAAARDGRTIPPDWAIDSDGQPTTDPQAALKGAMLPMSGHKGIGLAMMIQCLAGSLSGAMPPALNGAAPGSAPARVGAFMFVANPALIAGADAFRAHMGDWLQTYRRASGADGRYPGEGAARLEADRTRNGIPVSASVLAELRSLGETTGSRFSLKPLA